MKIVNLAAPAIIDDALRYPVEGPFTVTDAEAIRLKSSGSLAGDPEELPDETPEAPTPAKASVAKKEA